MEYAFYHPGTLVLITADHETGGLTIQEDGSFAYTQKNHTGQDVPIYAFGQGAEVFDGFEEENTTIPITIAGWWGKNDFGQQ
jgi:alkaline phosphatase